MSTPVQEAKFTEEMIQEALKQAMGIQRRAAEILGCSTKTIQRYLASHPDGIDYVEELRVRGEQLAHHNVLAGLTSDDPRIALDTAKFYLRYKCAWRTGETPGKGTWDVSFLTEPMSVEEWEPPKDRLER